jgi:hypothetical protein
MKGTQKLNEYRKNPKTNFMLAKRTKISQMSSKEVGGK